MKWTFHPKNSELTTSLPMSVEVLEYSGKASAHLSGIGPLELKRSPQGGLKADFYVTLPGTYVLELRDDNGVVSKELLIAQHNYLDFGNEFGTFFVLFLFVMGGIILWTRRIMQNKTP
jgi:hypothetical protein